MEERLNMSNKEIDRLRVIRNIIEGKMSWRDGSQSLGLSERQVGRLCARVRVGGNRGIIHGLRGRPSNHRIEGACIERALSALHDPRWEGFKPAFAKEKLEEFHGIRLSAETARKLMILTDLWKPHRRGMRHRQWRPRRDCVGQLVQLDGSDHDWFEGRGPRCVLLIYIDDATSRILYGEFVQVEDTLTLMRSTGTYLKTFGRPTAFYVDRDSIYKVNREASVEEQLRNEQPMTQFTRAMKELDIEVIAANSPQAKGRVERGFHTHQDRLVKELRLKGILTMEKANQFLWKTYIPEHNRRYSVEPKNSQDAHRPLLPAHDLASILSIKTQRQIQNDFTIRIHNRLLQLDKIQPTRLYPKAEILVEERLDGSLVLVFKNQRLNFKTIDQGLRRPPAPSAVLDWLNKKPTRPRKPAKNHPWRKPWPKKCKPALSS